MGERKTSNENGRVQMASFFGMVWYSIPREGRTEEGGWWRKGGKEVEVGSGYFRRYASSAVQKGVFNA